MGQIETTRYFQCLVLAHHLRYNRPSLCSDVVLGLPFLEANQIIIDHHAHTVVAKQTGFDLLHPQTPILGTTPLPFAMI